MFFELLEITVFDLLHEGFALEDVGMQIGGKPAGHDEKLIADYFRKRNGAARGNQMRTPLKDEAGVPESGDGEKSASGRESSAAGTKKRSGAMEENGKPENEKRSEGNEEAVAIGGDAGPIGIAGDEKIKGEEASKQRTACERFATPEEEESYDGEKKNGRPGEKTVIGREKHGQEVRRKPVPVPEGDIAGFEEVAVNEKAREESGEKTDEESCGEEQVAEEESRDARSGIGRGENAGAEGREVLAEGFDGEDGKKHGVGIINVEHEAGDQGKNQPLREGARGARLVPIPKKKSHRESGMRVRPGGIEIHVDGERTGPPDGERGEERPALFDILACKAEGQEQAEKTVEGGGEGHGDAVRGGKTVGGDGGTEGAREKNARVREKKKRHPENRGADGEMVVEVAGGRSKAGSGLVIFVQARPAKTFVGVLIVLREIEIVLDERSAGEGVIADAIAANPRVQKRKRDKKKKKKQPLRSL